MNHEKMMKTLTEISSKIFGWNADYYITEKIYAKKPITEEYEIHEIKNKFNTKVLIPDKIGMTDQKMIIHIPKSNFSEQEPTQNDKIFLKNTLYDVKNVSFVKKSEYYILDIEKYQQFIVKK